MNSTAKWLMIALAGAFLPVGESVRGESPYRVLVVNVDDAQIFYLHDKRLTELDHAPKGTELVVSKTIGEYCFCQYKDRPACILCDLLVTRQAYFVAEQKAKGLVESKGLWITSEEKFRQEQMAKGLVFVDGQWITPEENFRQRQIAKGLVQWKGRWVTPDEMKESQRAEFEATQRAKGLTLHNGEWISAEMLSFLENAKSLISQADDLFKQGKDYSQVQDLYKQAISSLQRYAELPNLRNTPDPEALALCSRVATNTAEIMKMIHDGSLTVLPDGQLVPKETNVTEQATAKSPAP